MTVTEFKINDELTVPVSTMSFARQTKAIELFTAVAGAAFGEMNTDGVVTEAEDLVTGESRTRVDFVQLIINLSGSLPDIVRSGANEFNTLIGLLITSNKEYKRLVLDGEVNIDRVLNERGFDLANEDGFDAAVAQQMIAVGMASLGSDVVVQSIVPLATGLAEKLGLLKKPSTAS